MEIESKNAAENLSIMTENNTLAEIKKQNMLLNTSEYEERKVCLYSLPLSLYIDVSKKCNLQCPSCFRSAPTNKDMIWPEIDFQIFTEIARELFPSAYRVILSGGGESLIHKDFNQMLELCLTYQVRPILYTNATTMNSKTVTLLARAGTYLGISIDSARKETFEKLRFPFTWEKMIHALHLIKKIREETNNEDFYPYLGVVLQKDNLNELSLILDLAKEFGFELIKFSSLDPYYPALQQNIPDPGDVEKALVNVLEKANENFIYIYSPVYGNTVFSGKLRELLDKNGSLPHKIHKNNPDRFVKYPFFNSHDCQIPWAETMITAEGKVVPSCCSLVELGDLKRDSFKTIWNNKKYKNLRKTVNSKKPLTYCRKPSCPFR